MSASSHSAATLERGLRRAVQNVYKSGNLEELTVKRVRQAVEVELGLEEGFFKTDLEWRDRSKNLICAEVVSSLSSSSVVLERKSNHC